MSPEAKRAYNQMYYAKKREEILAQKKTYYEVNKEAVAERNANCRDERAAYNRRYHAENREKIAERHRRNKAKKAAASPVRAPRPSRARSAEERRAKCRDWHAKNKDKVAARKLKHRKERPHLYVAQAAKRKARRQQATPAWADDVKIKAIYAEAARLTRETGVKHEVDHIVPLQSKIVCGLHCEANLQILTKAENAAKHNRFEPFA